MAIEVLQSLIAARVRNYPCALDDAGMGNLAYLYCFQGHGCSIFACKLGLAKR